MTGCVRQRRAGLRAGMIGLPAAGSGIVAVGGVVPGPVPPGWIGGPEPVGATGGVPAAIGSPEPGDGAAAERSASLVRAA